MWRLLLLAPFLAGCTYSVTMAHTEGTASDVVDTEQTTKPELQTNLDVPVNSPNSQSTQSQSKVPEVEETAK
jgi:hypothetical protein